MQYLILLLSITVGSAWAQTCQSNMAETASSDRFTINDNGTVTDSATGLQWMRCSLGQTWTDSACSGEPSQLNWQQALQQAHGYVFAEKAGWRLPNLKELSSITERSCVRPAINTSLFPSTAEDDYWTSTPAVLDPERAWVVAFFNGSNSIKQKNLFVFVRLVRTAD